MFFLILIFDPKCRSSKGFSLCTMAGFQNPLVFSLFIGFRSKRVLCDPEPCFWPKSPLLSIKNVQNKALKAQSFLLALQTVQKKYTNAQTFSQTRLLCKLIRLFHYQMLTLCANLLGSTVGDGSSASAQERARIVSNHFIK